MRLNRRTALAALILVAPGSATLVGCSGDDSEPPLPPSADAGPKADATAPGSDGSVADSSTTDAPSDASSSDSSSADAADAAPLPTQVRVAWFADPTFGVTAPVDAGAPAPTYDMCIAAHGSGKWQGPLLGSAGGALSLYDVSKYFAVPSGQYDVRVVFAGSGDAGPPTCALAAAADDAGLPPTDFTNLPALAAGESMTVVVTPSFDKTNPLNVAVVPLLDESSAPAAMVSVRYANVSGTVHSDPFDFGLGGGDVFTPLFHEVPQGQVLATASNGADAGTIDSNGYIDVAPFTAIDMSLMAFFDGTTDFGSTGSLDAPAGTILSAFMVAGKLADDGVTPASAPIVCFDGQTSTANALLTRCTPPTFTDLKMPPPVEARFGNLIADQGFPSIDVCVKYHSQATFPTLFGSTLQGDGGLGALDYGEVTRRYDLHAGFDFDLRVVAAGTDCTTPLAPDTTYSPPASIPAATVMFTGFASTPDAGPPLAMLTFPDLNCGEGAPVVRVVNLDAPSPQPVSVSFGGTPSWAISAVPYGSSAGTAALDACGYQSVQATTTTGNLTAGGVAFAYTVGAQTEDTLYVLASNGQIVSNGPIATLDCQDGKSNASSCVLLTP